MVKFLKLIREELFQNPNYCFIYFFWIWLQECQHFLLSQYFSDAFFLWVVKTVLAGKMLRNCNEQNFFTVYYSLKSVDYPEQKHI